MEVIFLLVTSVIGGKFTKRIKMKGVYKHGKRWRVRKYGVHLGCYSTKIEAEIVAIDAEKLHKELKK